MSSDFRKLKRGSQEQQRISKEHIKKHFDELQLIKTKVEQEKLEIEEKYSTLLTSLQRKIDNQLLETEKYKKLSLKRGLEVETFKKNLEETNRLMEELKSYHPLPYKTPEEIKRKIEQNDNIIKSLERKKSSDKKESKLQRLTSGKSVVDPSSSPQVELKKQISVDSTRSKLKTTRKNSLKVKKNIKNSGTNSKTK